MRRPVDPNDEALIEAMEHFESYSQPELAGLLAEQGLLMGGLIQNQRERIRSNIVSGVISLRDTWDYIDRREECGYQQIFLYRLVPGAARPLDPLGNAAQLWPHIVNYVKTPSAVEEDADSRLDPHHKTRFDPDYGTKTLVQYAAALQAHQQLEVRVVDRYLHRAASLALAGVYIRSGPFPHLFFKFVATRYWNAHVAVNGGFVLVARHERSAGYFRLNLDDGSAEIRLRNLRPRPDLSMRLELDVYVEKLRVLLGAFPFVSVLVEPVILRLLTSRRARLSPPALLVRDWAVVAGEKPLGGGVNPGFVQKLLLAFQSCTAIRLTGDWTAGNGGWVVRASLDGKSNAVSIPRKRDDGDGVTAVLQKIMGQKQRRLHIDAIRQLADRHASWRPTLSKYDRLFHDSQQRVVAVENMAEETWTPLREARDVAHALRMEDPAAFDLTYYVRCPGTKRRVRQRGQEVAFTSAGDIPAEIQCQHAHPRAVLLHDTTGRTEADLTYKRNNDDKDSDTLLPTLSRYLHTKLSPESAQLLFGPIALLIFFTFFAAAVAGASWVFSALAERFPKDRYIAYPGFALVLFFGTGIVVRALGPPATTMALKVSREILRFAKTVLGFGL